MCLGDELWSSKFFFLYIIIISPDVRESRTVLDSGFQVLDSSLCQWSLAQDSGFYKQYIPGDSGFLNEKFPGFWNPGSLKLGALFKGNYTTFLG